MPEVLLDGWPLVYAPNSPAALHLLALCAAAAPQFTPVLALPGEPPSWLDPQIKTLLRPTRNTPAARLGWEQQGLPVLARFAKAALIHTTAPSAPMLAQIPLFASPTWPAPDHKTLALVQQPAGGLVERLRQSLGAGGLANARVLWPADLPAPQPERQVERLDPLLEVRYLSGLHLADGLPAFEALELPENFVLYHGPLHPAALHHLFDAWSWAAGPLGEHYSLLVLGLPAGVALENPPGVRHCPQVPAETIALLYQRCRALFHPAPPSAWGDPLRWALAFGRPAVAARSPLSEAVAGPAAYLPPLEEARSLGAALISVLVQEDLADQLASAAQQRPQAWQNTRGRSLAEIYQ